MRKLFLALLALIPSLALAQTGGGFPPQSAPYSIRCTTTCSAANLKPGYSAVINKGTATSRNTTVTQTLDPDLVFTSVPVGTYVVSVQLWWPLGLTSNTGYAITTGGTATFTGGSSTVQNTQTWTISGCAALTSSFVSWGTGTSTTCATISTVVGEVVYMPGSVVYVGTSGSLGILWAQNTSGGVNSTLGTQSYLAITRLQ